MEFAFAVVGGLLAGWWADGKLGTDPWLTLGGVALGSFAGFWALYKAAQQMQARAEANERREMDDDRFDGGMP